MKAVIRESLLASCTASAMLMCLPAAAQDANTAGAAPPKPVQQPLGEGDASATGATAEDITVVGTRLGNGNASDVKRRALQSVSVFTADDIAKIPDTAVVDVVRRVPGVQIAAEGGGAIVTVRGLTQVEYRINGRTLAATGGRNFDIATLPSDFVSGIDVYKTPSASQIEGGIGGIIDFHTRRPFDFDGVALGATLRAGESDLHQGIKPYLSAYVSDRWDTGIGEIGLLIGGGYQIQNTGAHNVQTGNRTVQSGIGGTSIDAPVDIANAYGRVSKTIRNAYASAQWKPSSNFTLTGDFLYNISTLNLANSTLTANLSGGRPTGTFGTYPGTSTYRGGSYAALPLRSEFLRGNGFFEAYQTGLNGIYTSGPLTLSAEGSWTRTRFLFDLYITGLAATAQGLTVDATGKAPSFLASGIDVANPTSWRFDNFTGIAIGSTGDDDAYRADAIYALDSVLSAIKVGVRHELRTYTNDTGVAGGSASGNVALAGNDFIGQTRDDFFREDLDTTRQWVTLRADSVLDNPNGLRSIFGVAPGRPGYAPGSSSNGVEKVFNAYAEATFSFPIGGISVDGNAGLRYARTKLSINGTRNTAGGGRVPVNGRQDYDDWLPQVNVRAELVKDLYMRLGYSHQISRVDFFVLDPTLNLNYVVNDGSAGNPELEPLRAKQFDAALEWYFAPNSNLYGAYFHKDISGFTRPVAAPETIDGRIFQISRPVNGGSGTIDGAETGYQQRFSFLPGALAGLGMQASYTYVHNSDTVPFLNLSKHNYTLTGTFDRGALGANVAWVWRSKFRPFAGSDGLGRTLFRNPYGQLDAQIAYAVTPQVSLTASGINMLKRTARLYFGDDERAFSRTFVEDRRFLAGVQIKFGKVR